MLVSNPTVNSHPLTNNLNNSHTLHSSLPTSFSTTSLTPLSTTNPSTWNIQQVEEWLVKHDLNDCIDLICSQHRMNGQRLMNIKEEDVLQLRGTNKNSELWSQIKKLQQFYSSNYHLWAQRSSTVPQPSTPLTASSYFAPPPSLLQAPIPLRLVQPIAAFRPTIIPSPTIPSSQSQTSSSSASSHTTISIDLNQNELNSRCPTLSPSTATTAANQTQTSNPTCNLLERSPLTTSNSTNNHRRSLSHSLSTSSTSINILPPPIHRASNTLLHSHRTPADQIEDQPMTSCCFVVSIRADRKKTLCACLLALCTVYFCSFIITIVDERLPDPREFRPLPDLVLQSIKQIPWAFSVTEKIIVIEMATLLTIVILHRHR